MKKVLNYVLLLAITMILPGIIVSAEEFNKEFDFEIAYDIESEGPPKIIKVSDGYIGIMAKYNEAEDEKDIVLAKYTKNGKVTWKKTWGGNDDDEFYNVIEVSDGYVAVGSFRSNNIPGLTYDPYGYDDAVIVKFDKSGNVLWQKRYGDGDYCQFNNVIETEEGYLTVGDRIILYKKSDGTELKSIDPYYHNQNDILEEENGYVYIADTHNSSDAGALIKIDKNGNELWDEEIEDSSFIKIEKAADGSYYVSDDDGNIYHFTKDGTKDGIKFDIEQRYPRDDYYVSSTFRKTSTGYVIVLSVENDDTGENKNDIIYFDENMNIKDSKLTERGVYIFGILDDNHFVFVIPEFNDAGQPIPESIVFSNYRYGKIIVEEKPVTKEEISNPKTIDNIGLYIIFGITSILGLRVLRKKKIMQK